MIIFTCGSRFYGGQIDRIDNGFRELGHEVNTDQYNIDLIYSNDMAHVSDAIDLWTRNKKAKLILNVLDCPTFVPDWINIKSNWYHQLRIADKVTCISKTVQSDIKRHLDIDAEVIYNPIKHVFPLEGSDKPGYKNIFAIFVGRALAPNKRVKEIIWPLYSRLVPFWGKNCIHFIGSENPGFGVFEGVVSDAKLNELYNHSLFTLISSKEEGLNLPMIEALCANSIPIVCNDMSTAYEFAPPELICEPSALGMELKMIADTGEPNYIDFKKIWNEYGPKYRAQFSPKQISQNILNVYSSLL